ncbi:unnamed protein product [Mytilus edulis]|uniref:SUEL-type lectin domain-containing protein n=1 Tax=Mytilus edulis TaxID=6550 RepID=A0A8S3S907_MYTED|nr:unnamed protein product [Mytilus edulis]
MFKPKLFIIFCWFQNLTHAKKAMVSDGKGFDSFFKCLCNNNDATITDLSEHCTAENGKKVSHCLCNFTETELKESILKDCLSPKKTFCSGYKKMNQQGHCNKTLCMAAVMNCKDHITISTSVMPDGYENKINKNLCQGETLHITCPSNFVIVFDDANFGRGRSDSERCRQWTGRESTHCDNHKHTLKVLNDKCHEQQQCIIPVNKDIFGNPCLTITKYLNVKFHCKRKVNHVSENADNSANNEQTTYDGKENDRSDDRKGRLDGKVTRKKHSRNSDTTTDSDQTALNGNENENDRGDRRKHRWDRKDRRKKQDFENGAIVGISVGISCTLILGVIILAIYVCRRRSKKKKRKQQTRIQAIDQSGPSCSNKEQYNIPSTNKSLNTDEAQGEYFVLDPSFTKYDKDLSNRKLPEIKRCSGADGDDNVYYEIDEDNINSSSDMEGVHQKKIEVMDQGSHPNDLTINHTQLGYVKS